MNGKIISRNTQVISVSFDPQTATMLNKYSRDIGLSRSAVTSQAVKRYILEQEWDRLREYGRKTAQKLKITSEEDVYRIMGDA